MEAMLFVGAAAFNSRRLVKPRQGVGLQLVWRCVGGFDLESWLRPEAAIIKFEPAPFPGATVFIAYRRLEKKADIVGFFFDDKYVVDIITSEKRPIGWSVSIMSSRLKDIVSMTHAIRLWT
jgi:hypothetical protein